MLGHERFGIGEPSVAFVHGFTQTRESWRPIATRFSATKRVMLIDLPGHGSSTDNADDLPHAGRLLADLCPTDVVVGYSMGARVALHAAIQPGSAFRGLVLIGAHPGIESNAERDARRIRDNDLATRLEDVGLEIFIEEWLDQPMFESIRHLDHADRLTNSVHGLAHSLRHLGTGTQRVLNDRLPDISCQVLLIAGQRDVKFRQLAERMAARITNSRIVTISEAGHACHLEQPDATFDAIKDWIDSLENEEPTRQ